MKKIDNSIAFNMAYYEKKDWEKLVKLREDKENLHNTWEEWQQEFFRTKRNMEKQGLLVMKYAVDLDELARFCFEKNLRVDGKACAEFVSHKGFVLNNGLK